MKTGAQVLAAAIKGRLKFAREIAKTPLPERERRLRQLLIENEYVVVDER